MGDGGACAGGAGGGGGADGDSGGVVALAAPAAPAAFSERWCCWRSRSRCSCCSFFCFQW